MNDHVVTLPEPGDMVTLRSNPKGCESLRLGDKGIVERVNTDKGIVDVLWINGVRTVHVSWYSGTEERLFLSMDVLSVVEKEPPYRLSQNPKEGFP